MATTLPPVPYRIEMSDPNGIVRPAWADWFKQLMTRVGGNSANSNTELATSITDLSPQLVPTGAVLPYAGAAAPTGFLICDGTAVSRTTYSALFAAIGTAFGSGDGSTTFNLPPGDRFILAKGSTYATLGATGGAASTTLPNHAHSVSLSTGGPSGTANMTAGGVAVASSGHTHSVSGNTGNPTSNPTIATLPPYAVMNLIIKT